MPRSAARAPLLLVPLLWIAACAAELDPIDRAAEAIFHGALEPGAPWVVAVHHPRPDTGAIRLCSGTLIGPPAVLTAKHCVHDDTGSGAWLPVAPAALTVSVGRDVTTADGIAETAGVLEIHTTPGAYARSDALGGQDLALLVLDGELSATPRAIARAAPVVGSPIAIAGFGLTEADELGVKHASTATIASLDEGVFSSEGASWTCTGDSGGPALDVATGALVGVTSIGPSGCRTSTSYYTRVDRHLALLDAALGPPDAPPDATPPAPGSAGPLPDETPPGPPDERAVPAPPDGSAAPSSPDTTTGSPGDDGGCSTPPGAAPASGALPFVAALLGLGGCARARRQRRADRARARTRTRA